MSKMEKCCCCIPLNIGVVIIGILSLILDAGRFAAVLLYFPSIKSGNFELDAEDLLQMGLLSILTIFCFSDVMLIYGVIMKSTIYMVPWLMSVWFSWIVLIAGFIFQLAKPLDTTYHTAVSLGIFILYSGLTIGAYVAVYEQYMVMLHGCELTKLLEKQKKTNKL